MLNKYQEEAYKSIKTTLDNSKFFKEAIDKAKEYNKLKEILDEYNVNETNIRQILLGGNQAKELLNKATAKKPKRKRLYYNCHNGECDKTFIHYCPVCDFCSVEKDYANFCPKCGQALDWGDEND